MKISDLTIRERGSRSSHSRAMSVSNSSEIKNNSLVDEKTNKTGQTLIFLDRTEIIKVSSVSTG